MFKLVIQDDEGKTTVVPLIRDEITIGRKEGNTIRLTERNVSRRHARILRNNGEVQIEDLGSYNGIRVNNARIAERVSLRVSDQVQIGDYKLYLKAEGVEQIDDGTTRPVERIDNAPTDVMNVPTVPNVANVATQPIAVPAAAAPGPAPFIGTPGRTQVSLEPEPQRPVVSPKENPLTAPVGYGKLVVLSSNFAGKEFELSRPQMIVGRTDDNDIVVNHRSISRNHAKLTREPESGRYTISDLQSSNGVRVNGQDYGKVELRRGDVVDLGHVRLRFVEPGEDFIFSRDAVITDVPDSGSRRGLMIAIILSVIVIAGIVAFVMMKSGGEKKPDGSGSAGSSGGSGAIIAKGSDETPDAPEVPDVPIDAPGVGPTVTIDAPQAASNPASKDIEYECVKSQAAEKWRDLYLCSERLAPLNPGLAAEFKNRAVKEEQSAPRIAGVEAALSPKEKNLKKAKSELDQVWTGAAGYKRVKERYDTAENAAIADAVTRLNRATGGDCKEFNAILAQERTSKPPRVAAEAQKQVRCTPQTTTVTPPTACEPDQLIEKGRDQYTSGLFQEALKSYEAALACRADQPTIQKAFMSACSMRSLPKAKQYWRKLSQVAKQGVNNVCVRNGITEDDLNAP